MKKHDLFLRALFLLILVAILNYIAEVFYFHWTLWWYDLGLHFLGGFCAGTAFMYFAYKLQILSFEKIKAIVFAFIFVFLVGFAWEVFEIWIGHTSFSDGISYVRDTVSDLIIDCCGGFFATLYSFKYISSGE